MHELLYSVYISSVSCHNQAQRNICFFNNNFIILHQVEVNICVVFTGLRYCYILLCTLAWIMQQWLFTKQETTQCYVRLISTHPSVHHTDEPQCETINCLQHFHCLFGIPGEAITVLSQ